MTFDFKQYYGGKVLDVATGQGGFIQFLVENLKEYEEIIGIDTTASCAAALAASFPDNPKIHFFQMDALRMDFPDACFDTTCIANSLHHLADAKGALKEMRRVLKPGGRLVAAEMYRDGQAETQLTHVLLHHWWAAVDTALGINHHETFTRQQLLNLLEDQGLESLSVEESSDLSGDAKDPGLIQQLDGIIDRYKARTAGLPGQAELQQQGEELRARVHAIGFHGAASLLISGIKNGN